MARRRRSRISLSKKRMEILDFRSFFYFPKYREAKMKIILGLDMDQTTPRHAEKMEKSGNSAPVSILYKSANKAGCARRDRPPRHNRPGLFCASCTKTGDPRRRFWACLLCNFHEMKKGACNLCETGVLCDRSRKAQHQAGRGIQRR